MQNRLIKSELVSNTGRKSHGLSLTKQFSQHLEATISSCARTRQLHYNTLIKLISLDEIQKSTYDVLWIFTQVKRKRKVVSLSLSPIHAVELNPPRAGEQESGLVGTVIRCSLYYNETSIYRTFSAGERPLMGSANHSSMSGVAANRATRRTVNHIW